MFEQRQAGVESVICPDIANRALAHELESCVDKREAIIRCIRRSGKPLKVIAAHLGRDEKWLSRVMADNENDRRHFPPELEDKLMEVCENEFPLIWSAWARGYKLEPRETTYQRKIREQQAKLEEYESILHAIKGLFSDEIITKIKNQLKG